MRFSRGVSKKRLKYQHPFHKLNIGLIKEYSMIIPKAELLDWTAKGWIEDENFRDFDYSPEIDETTVLSRPSRILDIELENLVGKQIIDFCSYLGSYGMGGPGFFGLLIDWNERQEYLVYAVWASGEYVLMDERVLECHIKYNDTHRPWISRWAGESQENQWDDLSSILKGSTITKVLLTKTELNMELTINNEKHNITFNKYDELLPPHGNGEARKPAFIEGTIGEYIIFCNKNAVLHV